VTVLARSPATVVILPEMDVIGPSALAEPHSMHESRPDAPIARIPILISFPSG
jgi:hypothetical protein